MTIAPPGYGVVSTDRPEEGVAEQKLATPAFRTLLREINSDEVLTPLLRIFFHNPTFKPFSIKVNPLDVRPPDGWFHPSTHPLWEERQLYLYLTADPSLLKLEDLEQESSLAIMQGHFWHEVFQHALLDMGGISESEVYVEDPETGSRGSLDGIRKDEVVEIKTINGYSIKAMNSVEVLRAKKPAYYAQQQEYMRLSGMRKSRILFVNPNYPFPMNEFVIPYNEPFAEAVANKYRRVQQAVADQRMPEPCCNPNTSSARNCFARAVCPVGRMTK